MFKTLRTRLTLFNMMVILLLIVVIAFGAFRGSPSNDPTAVSQPMLEVALSGELPEPRLNTYRNHQGGLARIQLAGSGNIEHITSNLQLSDSDYSLLVQHALSLPGNSGMVQLANEREFLYFRIILAQDEGPVIVFHEVISTMQSLWNFLYRISPLLIFTVALMFFASLAMTQRALVPIKKAWQKQVEFTADASHELRTPLSVIQTNLECATDTPSETIAENKQWFDNIKAETARMTKLVNDLLILSRGDSSGQTVNKIEFSFDEVLRNTIETMRPVAEQHNISLQADSKLELQMYGDKELLNRLAVILLDNAIKYTPATGTVRISAERMERNIILKVTDTGIGIDKKYIEKIFDRFYRVDTARSKAIEGSGLGLSLAKWIAGEHGGNIAVESELGHGSEFTVTLLAEK